MANQSHLLLTNPELRFYPLEEAPVIQKGFLWKSNTTNPLVSQTPDSLAAVIARAQEASISSG